MTTSTCQFCLVTKASGEAWYGDETCECCRYLDEMSRYGNTEQQKRAARAELRRRTLDAAAAAKPAP